MPGVDRGPARRLPVVVALLALSAVFALGPSSPAYAEPPPTPSQDEVDQSRQRVASAAAQVGEAQAQLAVADARLQELVREASRAVEAYNGAVVQLEAAKAAAATAAARAAQARADLDAARAALGRFAAASYRSGDGGGIAGLLSAEGLRTLVDRTNALNTVGARFDDVLDRVRVAEVVAQLLDDQAAKALAAQEAATAAVEASKVEAETKVAAQQQQVAAYEVLRLAASTDLANSQTRLAELDRLRREGLAREAAERAQREAEARAATERAAAEQAAAAARAAEGSRPSTASTPPRVPAEPSRPLVVGPGASHGTVEGAALAIEYARAQIGKPYQWGAGGPDSFDCSGLTQMAWQAGGVSLPHWSVGQYAQALKIPASQLRPGDLVFFGEQPGDAASIYHVGLYIGGGRMIEAPHTGALVREALVDRGDVFGYARP
ncbi:MAG: C40 family peptidase [Candidatus Nanopelagicales bacterium]